MRAAGFTINTSTLTTSKHASNVQIEFTMLTTEWRYAGLIMNGFMPIPSRQKL
jgi:hypothetical protein